MTDNLIEIDNRDMRFIGVDDLFIKKAKIRESYNNMSISEREVYKWFFFYQLSLLKFKDSHKNYLKELLWDYINGRNVTQNLNFCYIEFCNRRDKSQICQN